MTDVEKREWLKCYVSPLYFLHQYVQIYDATQREWIPFHLWPAQVNVLRTILNNLLTIILKARQLGLTWLCLGFALWLMLFRPIATVLLFSKRDDEATYLLGVERLKGMYNRLPKFLQCRSIMADNDHEWMLSNGSVARAFPTSAGDSYTATFVLVDEADLVPDLNHLMNAVKPTIDAGGRMVLLSRVNKDTPESEFKKIYLAAKQKLNSWAAVFLPWHVRPERDAEWYERQKQDILTRTEALDDLQQQYPATDAEALAPRSLNKRIPYAWLERCYRSQTPLAVDKLPPGSPSIPEMEVYALPQPGKRYVIGADPAEGNPTSDDSAATVLDADTGEEVANLAGKFQPSTLAAHVDTIGKWFNNASAMVERNNHGHAVLLWLRDNSILRILDGLDGKEGWLSNTLGKVTLYDSTADAFRDQTTILYSQLTMRQLSSIEGSSLRAPEGQHDDRSDSYALAIVGMSSAARHASADWV
ncbi:MAG: hypothetical protein WCF84_19080 [Anaerolineae bacterium]